MPAIRALYWDGLPHGDTPNDAVEYAFWPSPVDHDACFQAAGFDEFADSDDDWDNEWLDIVARAVGYLNRYGASTVQRSPEACREIERSNWWQRLRGHQPPIVLASSLSIPEHLVLSSRYDQFGPCIASFGDIRLRTDSGHAILWITTQLQTTFDPDEIAEVCAAGRLVSRRSLEWQYLRTKVESRNVSSSDT
jgi:hypothetical protein